MYSAAISNLSQSLTQWKKTLSYDGSRKRLTIVVGNVRADEIHEVCSHINDINHISVVDVQSNDEEKEIEDFVRKFVWSGREEDINTTVTTLRHLIPKLMARCYREGFIGSGQVKIKHLWTKRPEDWPHGVAFVDPNNGPKQPSGADLINPECEKQKKPDRMVLMKMAQHLVNKYKAMYPQAVADDSRMDHASLALLDDHHHTNRHQDVARHLRKRIEDKLRSSEKVLPHDCLDALYGLLYAQNEVYDYAVVIAQYHVIGMFLNIFEDTRSLPADWQQTLTYCSEVMAKNATSSTAVFSSAVDSGKLTVLQGDKSSNNLLLINGRPVAEVSGRSDDNNILSHGNIDVHAENKDMCTEATECSSLSVENDLAADITATTTVNCNVTCVSEDQEPHSGSADGSHQNAAEISLREVMEDLTLSDTNGSFSSGSGNASQSKAPSEGAKMCLDLDVVECPTRHTRENSQDHGNDDTALHSVIAVLEWLQDEQFVTNTNAIAVEDGQVDRSDDIGEQRDENVCKDWRCCLEDLGLSPEELDRALQEAWKDHPGGLDEAVSQSIDDLAAFPHSSDVGANCLSSAFGPPSSKLRHANLGCIPVNDCELDEPRTSGARSSAASPPRKRTRLSTDHKATRMETDKRPP